MTLADIFRPGTLRFTLFQNGKTRTKAEQRGCPRASKRRRRVNKTGRRLFTGEADQTAYKPGSVPPDCSGATIIPLDRPSPDGSRDLPGPLGRRALPVRGRTRGPYSVLLLAGLAVPVLSPGPRC